VPSRERPFALGPLGMTTSPIGDENRCRRARGRIHLFRPRDIDVLVDNRRAGFRMPARFPRNPLMTESSTRLYECTTPSARARVANRSARHNTSFADHRMQRQPAPPVLVEDEFRRRLIIILRAQRPVRIVQIQMRARVAQGPCGLVVRVERPDVAPVASDCLRVAADSVVMKLYA